MLVGVRRLVAALVAELQQQLSYHLRCKPASCQASSAWLCFHPVIGNSSGPTLRTLMTHVQHNVATDRDKRARAREPLHVSTAANSLNSLCEWNWLVRMFKHAMHPYAWHTHTRPYPNLFRIFQQSHRTWHPNWQRPGGFFGHSTLWTIRPTKALRQLSFPGSGFRNSRSRVSGCFVGGGEGLSGSP